VRTVQRRNRNKVEHSKKAIYVHPVDQHVFDRQQRLVSTIPGWEEPRSHGECERKRQIGERSCERNLKLASVSMSKVERVHGNGLGPTYEHGGLETLGEKKNEGHKNTAKKIDVWKRVQRNPARILCGPVTIGQRGETVGTLVYDNREKKDWKA
jgi:hypothetical protein